MELIVAAALPAA